MVRPVLRAHLVGRTRHLLNQTDAAMDADDAASAVQFGSLAVDQARRTQRLLGPSLMALGLAYLKQSEAQQSSDRANCLSSAQRHLAEANRLGVPSDDRPRLNFALGKCLYQQGRLNESIPLLRDAVRDYPDGKVEALWLLTRSHLESGQPDLNRALEITSELAHTPSLSADQVARALESRTEILHRLGKVNHLAGLDLANLEVDSRRLNTLVCAQTCWQSKRYDEAAALLRAVADDAETPTVLERRSWYLLAMLERDCADDEDALSAFRRVELRYPGTEEACAAAVHAGEILLRYGRIGQAVAALSRAASQLTSDLASSPALVDIRSLDRLIAGAIDQLSDQRRFEDAAELLESYRLVASPRAVDRRAAELYAAWARNEWDAAESPDPLQSAAVRLRSAELFRSAGGLYVQAADAAAAPDEQAILLWRAAESLIQGESYCAGCDVLTRLLAIDAGELRPDALALACAGLDACGKRDLVPQYAEACIEEFPHHPAAAATRYYWALCQIAAGELEPAEAHLRENLDGVGAEAYPQILLESRLALARLLHDQGRDDEAIARLNEVLGESMGKDASYEARWLIADCLRHRARQPSGRLGEVHSEQAKAHYRRRREQDLEEAFGRLNALQSELAALEQSGRPSARLLYLLRLCRFAIAECLYELNRVDDARAVYEAVADTYDDPRTWLEAQIQIANCFERLHRIDDAQAVLRRTRDRLAQMPVEAIRQAQFSMSQGRWEQWLNWMDGQ
jgi:TolA-binding protein